MNMKEFKEMIMAQIGKSDPKAVQSLDKMVEELGKATNEEVRQLLNEIPIHDDLFSGNMRQTNPSPETIRVGPSQEASGGGAERMISQYSNVAPQQGFSLLYQEFSRKLDTLRKSVVTISEAVKAQSAVISHIVKSNSESSTETSSFSDEVSKAKDLIKKSKSLILKSELYGIEDGSVSDAMEDIRKAELFLKKAKALLIKAEEEDEKEEKEEKEVEKSLMDVKKFSQRLDKAKTEIMDIVKSEEEKEKKEREDKEMKAKKAEEKKEESEDKETKAKKAEEEKKEEEEMKKAKDSDKGNQKDSANKDGNQKDAAAKSEDVTNLVKKTVSEMMDIITNRSRSKDLPDLSKAQTETYIVAKSAQIDEAYDNGVLSSGEEMTARSILSMIELAQKGEINPSIVNDRIFASSSAVQSVFN